MTTMTLETTASVRRLEELVDRLLAALLGGEPGGSPPSLARTVHEARRLRQSGDLDAGAGKHGGRCGHRSKPPTRNCGGSTPSGWTSPGAGSLAKGPCSTARPPGRRRSCWFHGTTGPPGSGLRPGDALAGGQGRLKAQPAGAEVAGQGRFVMVAAHTEVDFAELKARNPLGDAVEAAGVVLHGKGRVRQGICPFHQETEGSFTVYANTEKFWCFGCGPRGDVLDFVGRMDGLTLTQVIRRLDDGSAAVVSTSNRPAPARPTAPATLPPRDPALLTAAARFYGGQLRRSPVAVQYLASRGIGLDAAIAVGSRLRHGPAACGSTCKPPGFTGTSGSTGQRPVPGTGRGAVRRDHHRSRRGIGPGAVAHRKGGATRRQAPLPGVARLPSRCWVWQVSVRRPLA